MRICSAIAASDRPWTRLASLQVGSAQLETQPYFQSIG